MRRIVAALLVTGVGFLAPDAGAAVVTLQVLESQGIKGGVDRDAFVRIVDAGDEANRIVITSSDSVIEVRDDGAPLTAGAGCATGPDRSVRCEFRQYRSPSISVDAGRGDDHLDASALHSLVSLDGGPGADHVVGGATTGTTLEGGPGDDHLVGGAGSDRIGGGSGSDVLRAGAGDDHLSPDAGDANAGADTVDGGPGEDFVSYEGRTTPVSVDLADPGLDGAPGDLDVLTAVEGMSGGSGSDRLAGDAGPNQIDGGPYEARDAGDTLEGRGGDDQLDGGRGTDTLSGGPGADLLLDGGEGDRLDGGAGNDFFGPGSERKPSLGRPRPSATLRCGTGRDLVTMPHPLSLVSRDCDRISLEYVDMTLDTVDRRRRVLHLRFIRGSVLKDPLCRVRAQAGRGWADGPGSPSLAVGYRPRPGGTAAVRVEAMRSCRRKRFEPQLTVLLRLDAGR